MNKKSETWNRKLAGGVEGARSHAAGQQKKHERLTGTERFIGAGILAQHGAVDAVEDWAWVGAARPWARKRMASYLRDWLAEHKLLRGPIDTPAFTQLIEVSMLIQQASKLRDAEKNPERQIAMGRQVVELWGKARAALAGMNLKDAQEAAGTSSMDINDEYLKRFETDGPRPPGAWDPVAKRVVPAHNGDTEI